MPQHKVNWNMIRHHHRQAQRALRAMDAASCDSVKLSFFRTAVDYMEECMRLLECEIEPLRNDQITTH